MAIHRPIGKMTTIQFLKKVYKESKKFQELQALFNARVDKLAQAYISQHCMFQVGNKITFKQPTPQGYTLFVIEKIIPDCDFKKRTVRFRAAGKFSKGHNLATEPGSIWLDDLKPIQFDEKPKQIIDNDSSENQTQEESKIPSTNNG